MKRLLFSMGLSLVLAVMVGLMLRGRYCGQDLVILGWDAPRSVIGTGVSFAIIVNLLFFYIRRWDGCIEKLGGLTFSLLILFAALMPLSILSNAMPDPDYFLQAWTELLILQVGAAGLVATVALRTSYYDPPKPGEPLHW